MKTPKQSGYRWLVALALAASTLLPAAHLSAKEEAAMDMEKMIMSAKSSADHEAIAAEYEAAAIAARAKAKEHLQMAEAYEKAGGVAIAKWHLDAHCKGLAASYEKAAKENESLAKAHRELAKAAK